MKLLVFGSANIDYSLSVNRIVVPGETVNCTNLKKSAGGKGANQAYAIARAGAKPYFAGKVGADGKFILDKLDAAGVDVSLVSNAPNGTGCAFIQVDAAGQNSIVVYGGGNQEIERGEVDAVLAKFGAGDAIVLNGEIGQLDYIYNQGTAKGLKIYLNPSPINAAVKALDLQKASVLFFNEIEGAYFAGSEFSASGPGAAYERILHALTRKYPNSEIVLTVGSQGAYYAFKTDIFHVPPVKTAAIDTTGAGDTFMGYFIAQRCHGKSAHESMVTATKAAAITVSRPGAMDAIPAIAEVVD